MKLIDWLKKWKLETLKINVKFLELEFKPNEADKNAAWELYIELITRVSTQYLEPDHGDEDTALRSIYTLFPLTRDIIKNHGKDCIEFTKIAIVVLNQVIRPFTAKWHKLSLQGAFTDPAKCENFRKELKDIQDILRNYTRMLSAMAEVEDLTDLEDTS